MRLFVTVAIVLASMMGAATAQTVTPESRNAAIRLVKALNMREVMEPVRLQLLRNTKINLQTRLREELESPTNEELAEMNALVDQLASKYTLDDTIDDLIPLLQAHYSVAEMEELTSFFSSATYKKFEAEMPKINNEAVELVTRKIQPAIRETVSRISSRIDEMKKSRSGQ
jgi:hypothetical protein